MGGPFFFFFNPCEAVGTTMDLAGGREGMSGAVREA